MLELKLAAAAGRVIVSSDPASAAHLQVLRSSFLTAVSISNLVFDVELDDLLVNLHHLAVWPETDEDVRWQPELLTLVYSNDTDAKMMQSRLADGDGPLPLVAFQLQGNWTADLRSFQQKDIGKLLDLGHGANFSVPGAGKTRVTLAVFHARRTAGQISRMLVVCPKAAFESWQIEAEHCFKSPPLRVAVMTGPVPPPAELLLINYERLPDTRAALSRWLREQPAMLVLDEAHRMKLGPAGAWGTVCLALAPYAASRMILTGTPAPNGARDLENLLAFVWPGQGRAAVTRALAGNDLRSASRQLRPLFTRTTKKDLDLPPTVLTIQWVDLAPLHREIYNALLGQASATWRSGAHDIEALGKILLYLLMAATTPALLAAGSSPHEPLPFRVPPLHPAPGTTLSELMRDLPHYEFSPKYQAVLTIVAANAAKKRKTLVWSTFVRNLKSLEILLARFKPAIVHGGTPDRAEQLKRFREDPDCLVLLSNPATLGEGVSLHRDCHDAVYLDRDFSAGRFMQSLDRIHRLGLPPGTLTQITVLAARQTIDELVAIRLTGKLDFMGQILDDPAVLQLGDLAEEPNAAAGMDSGDFHALVSYLSGHASS